MPAPVLVHVAVMVVPLAPVVVVAAMGRVMVSLRDHDDLSVVLRVPLRLRVLSLEVQAISDKLDKLLAALRTAEKLKT